MRTVDVDQQTSIKFKQSGNLITIHNNVKHIKEGAITQASNVGSGKTVYEVNLLELESVDQLPDGIPQKVLDVIERSL